MKFGIVLICPTSRFEFGEIIAPPGKWEANARGTE